MISRLPNNLVDFDKLILEPFCIFEKDNFLEENFYNDLRDHFPKKEYLQHIHDNGKKIFLGNEDNSFFDFINSNYIWKKFYYSINNYKFLNFMIQLIISELQKIDKRKKIKKYFFNKKYNNSFLSKVSRKTLKLLNFQNIRMAFEFSIIKKECFIPPHCDKENKLLSLMLYFPPKNSKNVEGFFDLGTNFYSIRDNFDDKFDIWESKYLDENNTKLFNKNYKVFYKSKFEENKLVGFIKNDKSWHDVSKFNFEFDRRSVNINFFFNITLNENCFTFNNRPPE